MAPNAESVSRRRPSTSAARTSSKGSSEAVKLDPAADLNAHPSSARAFNLFLGAAETVPAPPILPKDSALRPDAVRRLVPEELFRRSALTSFWHLARSLALAALLFAAATRIATVPSAAARAALWAAYWVAQGTVLTGVWVIAHECGHQSFSDSKLLNDSVGWVLHSALLVPYHSWRISHANHHSNTCSMEHDEVFVPSTLSEYSEMVMDTPLFNALDITKMLVFGWPFYLAANFAGPAKYRGKANSHFNPAGALFEPHQFTDVLSSDLGFFGALGLLALACREFGVADVACFYFVPYLVVNLYLVLITYLQHTDSNVPHYRESEFTFMRGALSTTDRSFGWVIDDLLHHIADTHVCHHLFSTMPFYNAVRATAYLRAALGPHYLRDHTPIAQALWRSWRNARFVDDKGDILFMKGADALNKGIEKRRK